MKSNKGMKSIIIALAFVFLVAGYYYYLSHKTYESKKEQLDSNLSPVQEILVTNFKVNYPPTAKEVVKKYMDITKVLHNESLNDEEIESVATKLQELFDEELIYNKTQQDYYLDLKSELATFKNNNYSIVNYYTASSTEVDYFSEDGYDLARLYGTFNIRTSKGTQVLTDVFVLRKDTGGRWKIYGWQPVVEEE